MAGNVAEGFAELERMRRYCAPRELHWCDAELLIAEADLLCVRRQRDDLDRAETLLREAIAVASRQGARLFALRAAVRLFRLIPQTADTRKALYEIRHDFPSNAAALLLTEADDLLRGGPKRRRGSRPRG